MPNNFLVSLNQVKNQDLAEFYFGETDAIRVLSDSKDIRLNTLLQSKEYIELKLQKQTKSIKISDYSNEIMKSAYKLHLFLGQQDREKVFVCENYLIFMVDLNTKKKRNSKSNK